jgi:hypothetical protein
MKRLQTLLFSFCLLIALLCLFANCIIYGNIEDRVTKVFTVGQGGTLTLECDLGSIAVRGEETDSVEVEILREVRTSDEKKAEEILKDYDIQFSPKGPDVSIQAKYKKRGLRGFWNNIGKYLRVKYMIIVPSEYNVDLQTKGGSISVQDLRGEVKSNTSGGGLNFDNIDGNIYGRTSGGSIKIGTVKGSTDIHTSGGSITIRLAEGPVDAQTSGGSITVEEVMGTIKAHTSGGSVKATITRQPESDCRLTTSGGTITVFLSDDFDLNLNAETSGGNVQADFPIALSGDLSKRSIQGRMNGGGPELYLRSSGGSIYLKKL